MCGRYTLFTDTEAMEIRDIIEQVQRSNPDTPIKTGEIFPTNTVPILLNDKLRPEAAIWGFPNYARKGVIINARSETAPEKKTFKNPMLTSRCVVPSTGFYEWTQDDKKIKYLFARKTLPLYMAGLYSDFAGERRFVILTTAANSSVADVHNRMPVILESEELKAWASDTHAAFDILSRMPPPLARTKA